MRTSKSGIDLIKRFEGCRLEAYKCAAGVWTIGYGHTSGVKRGARITYKQAEEYLKKDIAVYERAVSSCRYIGWTLSQNQFDALVSFAYNLGASKLKSLCEGRSPAVVADKILLYNKAAGKVNQGLIDRREAERALFLTGSSAKKVCPYREPRVIVASAYDAKLRRCSKYTSRGDDVRWVQWHLKQVGYQLEVDGVCGEITGAAITDFQEKRKLAKDGLCGTNTRAALKEAIA